MKFTIGALTALLLVQASTAFTLREVVAPRITEGKDAHPGEFPYQVSLQWGIPPLVPFTHSCGGSILNENWILTAGHCVTTVPKLGRTIVKVGKHHIVKDDSNVQTIEIHHKFVHEDYPGNVAPNDIALMKLRTPIRFNDRVKPIKLPEPGTIETGEAVLTGWGSTSKKLIPKLPQFLQHASVPIVSNDECERAIKAISTDGELYDSQMCTGPLDGTIAACSGDSGGPLAQFTTDEPVIVGIVSWGMYPCGSVGAPSIYTRVSSFVDWINQKMSEN